MKNVQLVFTPRQPKVSWKGCHACSCWGGEQGMVLFWCSIKDYGHAWHDANHIDVILCINNDASTSSLKVWGLAYEIGDEDWEGGVSQNLANFNRAHLWVKFSTFHQLFLVPLSISLSALVGSSKRQQILWEYHWSTKITRSNETYLGHFHLWVRFPCTSSTYQWYIFRCGRHLTRLVAQLDL